jgi:hypothetical protein
MLPDQAVVELLEILRRACVDANLDKLEPELRKWRVACIEALGQGGDDGLRVIRCVAVSQLGALEQKANEQAY